jgi:hypothetical protein
VVRLTQLEIDECLNWILHTIVSEASPSHNHIVVEEQGLEFIIITAKDYYIDVQGLLKIEKITGMTLVQVRSVNGISDLWFGRKMQTPIIDKFSQNKSMR